MEPQLTPPTALLVILAVQRHGADDWSRVSEAVGAALAALGYEEDASAARCEEVHREQEAEEGDAALSKLAGDLTASRVAELTAVIAALRAAAADGQREAKSRSGARRASTSEPAAESTLSSAETTDGVDPWVELAQEEKNPRRASVQGALLKFVVSITKHRWAHPFKRPVTEKEAPDYREIVTDPMDFSTLRKKVEGGAIRDVASLVSDLNLIFNNAMLYNPKGSDYHTMASTLKTVVAQQLAAYSSWYIEAQPAHDSPFPPLGEAAAPAEASAAAHDDADEPDEAAEEGATGAEAGEAPAQAQRSRKRSSGSQRSGSRKR